jgi:hypothetical protein
MSVKEKGIVESVSVGKEDHGVNTVWVFLKFNCSGQGFGGLCLDGGPIQKDFIKEICNLFEVTNINDIVGKKCYALRCFDHFGSNIEGLMVGKKKFTLTSWRRKHWPDETKTPLETKIDRLYSDIRWAERRIVEAKKELMVVKNKYVDWEG